MSTAVAGTRGFSHDARYLRPEVGRPLPRRRARSGWRRAAFATLKSLCAVLLILAGREGARHLLASRAFELKNVEIEGCTHARPDEIRALVRRASMRNMLDIELAEVRRLAESHPWVRHADIRRRLPDTISLAVTERIPAGVALLAGRPMLVDEEGAVLAECGTVGLPCDSPVMTGLDPLAPDARAERIARGVAALRAVERLAPALGSRVSELDLSDAGQPALRLSDGGPLILLSPEEPGRNLHNFLSIQDDIEKRFEDVQYLDLRFRGRIAVMPAQPSAPLQAAAVRR